MTISGDDQTDILFRGGSANQVEAAAVVVSMSAGMWLFRIDAIAVSTKKGSSHTMASSTKRFASHVNLKIALKPVVEMVSLG